MRIANLNVKVFGGRPAMSASIAALLLGGGLSLHGQVTPETMPQRGLVPAGSYSVSDLETINSVNGNVFYQIPLASLPPGRAGWGAGLKLTYNSQIYDVNLYPGTSNNSPGVQTLYHWLYPSQWGGWQYGYTYSLDLEVRPSVSGSRSCGVPSDLKGYKLSVISPDGSHHTMHLYGWWDDNGDGYYEVGPAGDFF